MCPMDKDSMYRKIYIYIYFLSMFNKSGIELLVRLTLDFILSTVNYNSSVGSISQFFNSQILLYGLRVRGQDRIGLNRGFFIVTASESFIYPIQCPVTYPTSYLSFLFHFYPSIHNLEYSGSVLCRFGFIQCCHIEIIVLTPGGIGFRSGKFG